MGASQLRVQADGELLGPTPTEISIIPKALTLLIAPEAAGCAQQRNPAILFDFEGELVNLSAST